MNLLHSLYSFIHLWIHDCFNLLAIVNKAAMNMGLQISPWDPAFNSLRHMPRSRIAGSCDHHSIFNSTIYHIIFHNCCSILHSHQQSIRVPSSPTLGCIGVKLMYRAKLIAKTVRGGSPGGEGVKKVVGWYFPGFVRIGKGWLGDPDFTTEGNLPKYFRGR